MSSLTELDASGTTGGSILGGGLSTTSTGAGGTRSSRPMTGLVYFEATITTLTGTPAIGIASSNWNHSTSLGTGSDTVGYLSSGAVKNNNATLTTLSAYVQGNRIGVAVDVPNRLIWFRINGGNWNNSGTADPVTDTGGIDWSSALIATPYMALSWSTSGTEWDANFSGPFTDTPPTGYGSMDTITYATVRTTQNPVDVPALASPATDLFAHPFIGDETTGGHQFSPAGPITVVSGTTKENGSIVAGKLVEVFDRISGDRLGYAYSDVSGNWSIPCLGRPTVRVVGSDPTTYNSQVFDDVIPV